MTTIRDIVFLHQIASPCNLAMLAKASGYNARVYKNADDIDYSNTEAFCFISHQGASLDSKGVPLLVSRLISQVPVALYQVDQNAIDAETALLMGIRGLLYNEQRMDLMMGLKKMLQGELWYERPILSKVFRSLILKVDNSSPMSKEAMMMLQALTGRERTIIKLVGSGARNKEIAQRLCISEHTVKAHISSIFRKTQSRNRVELLRWAQTHQGQFELMG
ncbi:LuxR C-terminal-related transcriptional regulator [Shewanella sp. NIFS-20-20]|uniref:response regulator transcription factor n=1 Tax=Shewanella sp. NIFS-20-20 TaxID=2853806 RepID=UPI001C457679|nr:LuxR C-terminal-related transcriptional regulator [Shewanella sp. NIFS-20-20]MBV7314107.1 LuxR C-terminal-related transcriptional regulator [Shewanella sp. NIFS-20-20]